MNRSAWILTVIVGVATSVHADPVVAPGFQDRAVISGLDLPVALEFAPTGEIFVAEKDGVVKRFAPLPSPGPGTVVLDLRTEVASYQDRGLLGLAIDPGYPLLPYVYVLYSYDAPPAHAAPFWNDACGLNGQPNPIAPGAGCVVVGRLARYTMVGGVLTNETVLIEDAWYQQYPSHSIGDLAFGRDGNLYVSAGDGASYQFHDTGTATEISTQFPNPGDPTGEGGSLRAQDLLSGGDPVGFSGTILRIDPATGRAAAGDPLTGDADRIIAFGLRNPFRISVRPGTDELWISDVGADHAEELDRISDVTDGVIENFGWPCYEGGDINSAFAAAPLCHALITNALPPQTPGTKTSPVFSYLHGAAPGWDLPTDPCQVGTSAAITGLAFAGGTSYPPRLQHALLFADYAVGCVYALRADAAGIPDPTQLEIIERNAPEPVDLTTGPDGDIYYVSLAGDVRHLRWAGSAPTAIATASVTSGTSPLMVQLDGSASTDPDATALAYAWDLDGDGAFDDASTAIVTTTFGPGSHTVRLQVTDAAGEQDISQPITIVVDDRPPVPVITSPAAGEPWHANQLITFAGTATDPDEGSLAPATMRWTIALLHCPGGGCHRHPIATVDGADGGSFVTAPDGSPAHYEITLEVTDAMGVGVAQTITIDAAAATVTLATDPIGFAASYAGDPVATPSDHTEVVGTLVPIEVAPTIDILATHYVFAGWSDGGERAHTIEVPATNTTYTARYAPDRDRDGVPDPEPDHGGCATAGSSGSGALPLVFLFLCGLARRRK